MASGFEIKLDGYESLMKALKELPEEKLQEVEDEFEAAAYMIETLAKQYAPKDQGQIANSISNRKTGPITFEVVVQKSYAPFVEFGTKSKVQIPAELQAVAAQYRNGQRNGGSMKKAIYDWAKRKGIPKERWYVIYRSILVNGIRPHPFFFRSFFQVRPKLIKRITDIMNQ